MADALKHFFDRRRVEAIAADLVRAWRGFPREQFVREATAGLGKLELLDRGRHIAAALGRALPPAYARALRVVVDSLGPPNADTEGNGMAPFHYLPHTMWIAERGIGETADVLASLAAQRELTRRFSCEWSIRPFIDHHPVATMAALERWAGDDDEHVRRLVSEGTRPRLPWAPRLHRFADDPAPVLRLLERLKDDDSEYVRRSVANHLNDITRAHPALVLALCERWLTGAGVARRKLVVHALRSLVKADDPHAIRLVGGTAGVELAVKAGVAPRRAQIGSAVWIEATVTNPGRTVARAVVTGRVHFVKASGETSPKTFKLPTVELAPGASVALRKKVSVAQHTTRTHFPGRHRVEVVVNGAANPAGEFVLFS